MLPRMRVQAVINKPHLTDWYSTSKLSDWIRHWLYNVLDAQWHWYRFEYQARGSTHAHGCAKLGNDPGICELVTKAGIAWYTKELVQAGQQLQDDVDYEELIRDGEQAEAATLEYSDWLVPTMNQCIPDDSWSFPVPHPCSVSIKQPEEATDQDYSNLVNIVQRHTRCSTTYCLRRKQRGQGLKCRFDYPPYEQSTSSLTFERFENGTIKATLITRHNDPRVNAHNRLVLQHWRANVDIQIIIDATACARYMVKYAAKSEPRSKPVSTIFKSCVKRLSNSSNPHTVLRSTLIRSAGERDFSAQETAHQLLSLCLVGFTYKFMTLSLNNNRALLKDPKTGKQSIEPSLIDCYATRLVLPDINLITFTSNYTVNKGEPQRRPTEVIVRTFPRYSRNPKDHSYSHYCMYQPIKYKPWTHSYNNAWVGHTDTEEVYIEAYHSFLQSPLASQYIPQFNRNLQLAQHAEELAKTDSQVNASGNSHNEEEEEWVLPCRFNQQFATNDPDTPNNVNWCAFAESLPPEILQACPSWVRAQCSQTTTSSVYTCQIPIVDHTTLNSKQRKAYDIIHRHFIK